MLSDYQSAIDALSALGLNARLHSEGAGRYLLVPLEGRSAIHIGDFADTLPDDAEQLTGWSAQFIGLNGLPTAPSVYRALDTDLTALTEAIEVFLRRRYTWGWLTVEVEDMFRDRLGNHMSDLVISSDGPFATIAWTHADSTHRLRVSSYPHPTRGIHTTGEPVTGWRATTWTSSDFGDPTAEGDAVYDEPEDPDTERLIQTVRSLTRKHLH